MGVQGKMRGRMSKFGVIPFAMGCVSQASIAVAKQRPRRRRKLDLQSPTLRSREDGENEDEESLSGESTRHSSRFLALPITRANLSTGVNKLVKGFKSLSQLFIYEDEMEELGMEIGCPTDVKHVAHIGWDSLANTNPFMKWDMDIDMDTDIRLSSSSPTVTPTLKHIDDAPPENDSSTFFTFNSSSTL
ncbi:CRIB domain-containing protein RIC4-like [Silene latifolia]|uniref:CRIB domain-containing protein RIC4-like n=1 Tax=Silene latifolia TaxID=37657 RepID=UPI003D77043A